MQAQRDGMSIDNLFSSNVQYGIPIYQRRYVWTETNWSTLWEDIKEKTIQRINGSPRDHFTGSIVAWPGEDRGNIPKYEIIDGQQRLTTFQIILCVIRDSCASNYPGSIALQNIAKSADQLIKNEEHLITVGGTPIPEDQYKLRLTTHDENAFQVLVHNRRRPHADEHLLYEAYDYFKKEIEDYSTTPEQITQLFHSIIRDFTVVQIDLDADDEPRKDICIPQCYGKNAL